MLVLSRKINQSIDLSDGVRITITAVKGSRVSVGIEAPDEIRIVRTEIKRDRESEVETVS
ncbi:MAG: carbon storage regulator [Planctomycetota bacterium]